MYKQFLYKHILYSYYDILHVSGFRRPENGNEYYIVIRYYIIIFTLIRRSFDLFGRCTNNNTLYKEYDFI